MQELFPIVSNIDKNDESHERQTPKPFAAKPNNKIKTELVYLISLGEV